LPARGGTAPETMAEAKLFAPNAFRDVLERAITGDDYASLAADNARRLEERPALVTAVPDGAYLDPSWRGSDSRTMVEEEPGVVPLLGPEPFRRLQGAKGTLRWTGRRTPSCWRRSLPISNTTGAWVTTSKSSPRDTCPLT
jgi:hypothetical protein